MLAFHVWFASCKAIVAVMHIWQSEYSSLGCNLIIHRAGIAGKGAILAGMQLDNSATLACRAILADLCCILAFFQCMLVRVWLEIFFIDRACYIGLGGQLHGT